LLPWVLIIGNEKNNLLTAVCLSTDKIHIRTLSSACNYLALISMHIVTI